jgi:hypothetical protein
MRYHFKLVTVKDKLIQTGSHIQFIHIYEASSNQQINRNFPQG